jgi:hypothetical protein
LVKNQAVLATGAILPVMTSKYPRLIAISSALVAFTSSVNSTRLARSCSICSAATYYGLQLVQIEIFNIGVQGLGIDVTSIFVELQD